MPIRSCRIRGKSGFKWGNKGKCYTGKAGRRKAARQARAILATGWREKHTSNTALPKGKRYSSNPLRIDPTRTASLRRGFCAELTRRLQWLKRQVRELLITQDALGLEDNRSILLPKQMSPIQNAEDSNGRWRFHTSAGKVRMFKKWLGEQIKAGVLPEKTGDEKRKDDYYHRYAEEGYKKGAGRAFNDVKRSKLKASRSKEHMNFYKGSREQFLKDSFARPVAIEKIKLLAERTYTDLQGFTNEMATKLSRKLTDGLVEGKSPREIASGITKEIDISKKRALTIARTEIIRTHAEGQLDALEGMGVEEVGVAAEWSTTGDEKVCEKCAPLEGIILKIYEARNLLPRHPNCFISSRVNIYTDNGWLPLGDIRTGDMVLTHKVRFRKVLQLHRNSGSAEVVEFRIGWGGTNSIIAVTADHPLMVNKCWVTAGNINVGDRIRWMKTDCQGCGKSIPFGLKYCNQKCQWMNKEHRTNVAQKNRELMLTQYAEGIRDGVAGTRAAHAKVRELIASGQFDHERPSGAANGACQPEARRKNRLSKLGTNNPAIKSAILGHMNGKRLAEYIRVNPDKHANYICAQKGHKTQIERLMGEALVRLGIDAHFNYPEGGKWIDWAVVDKKVAIECDGAYWHKDKEKDNARDVFLQNRGWTVLRFSDTEIILNSAYCAAKVARVLSNHEGDYKFTDFEIVSVTKSRRDNLRMYNISVEEDESYIAKGCVSHNCRCAWLPAGLGEDDKDQKTSKKEIMAALSESLDEDDTESWIGADLEVDKKRPESIFNVARFEEDSGWLATFNVFCATGPGGGVDPSCSGGSGGFSRAERIKDEKSVTFGGRPPESNKEMRNLYHTTSPQAAIKIMKEGLKPSKDISQELADEGYGGTDGGEFVYFGKSKDNSQDAAIGEGVTLQIQIHGDEYRDKAVVQPDIEGGLVMIHGHIPPSNIIIRAVHTNDKTVLKAFEEMKEKMRRADNVFCPTGSGGGVDPSCPALRGHAAKIASAASKAGADEATVDYLSRALAGLSKKAAKKVMENLPTGVEYHETPQKMTAALAKKYPEVKDWQKKGNQIAGMYEAGLLGAEGKLHLAGEDNRGGKGPNVISHAEVIAHEISHALDGSFREYSSTREWGKAWSSELQDSGLSKHTAISPSEGFAEFGRLILLQPDKAKEYKKAYAFWKSRELI